MKVEERCNICHGLRPSKKHKNTNGECIDHRGVKPQLWNFHPEFLKFYSKGVTGEGM